MAAARPNILFVQADQMAVTSLPIHGHPLVKAPALSRLADEGVTFDAAYCNSPLCAPSRFAMMSGQLASSIEAYDNAAEFPSHLPTFAHHLRLAGYRTGLVGKMHFVGADQLHGFERRRTTDIYPADFGWTADWSRPDERLDYFHTPASITGAGPCARSLQLDYDEEVAYQAQRTLFDLAREDDDRPFFLCVSFTHPHDPYNTPAEYWSRYEGVEIDPPKVPAIPMDRQDPHSARLMRCYGLGDTTLDEETILRARRAYYGSISYIDDKLAALRATLEATGAARDTVVIFTGDHGDMLGERGLWYKMSLYEGSARVPLILHCPNRFASRRVAKPVSLVDLFPTLLDLAGPEAPGPIEPLPGRSLLPLAEGAAEAEAGPTEALVEYLGEGVGGPVVMIRRDNLKYIVGDDSPAQLFDPVADPTETNDLIDDPAQAETAAAFAREVDERWDLEALKQRVIRNQQRRLLVGRALKTGSITPWDYQPPAEAAASYVRNTIAKIGDLEGAGTLPLAE